MALNWMGFVGTAGGACIASFGLQRYWRWKENRKEIEMVRLKNGRYRDIARVRELRFVKWYVILALAIPAILGVIIGLSQQ